MTNVLSIINFGRSKNNDVNPHPGVTCKWIHSGAVSCSCALLEGKMQPPFLQNYVQGMPEPTHKPELVSHPRWVDTSKSLLKDRRQPLFCD